MATHPGYARGLLPPQSLQQHHVCNKCGFLHTLWNTYTAMEVSNNLKPLTAFKTSLSPALPPVSLKSVLSSGKSSTSVFKILT